MFPLLLWGQGSSGAAAAAAGVVRGSVRLVGALATTLALSGTVSGSAQAQGAASTKLTVAGTVQSGARTYAPGATKANAAGRVASAACVTGAASTFKLSFVAATTAGTTAAATSQACNVPAGVQDGDLLVASVEAKWESAVGPIIPPSGWVERVAHSDSNSLFHNHRVYTRVASSEPASYTWSITSSTGSFAIVITAWRPTGGSVVVETTASTQDAVNDTTVSSNGITTLSPYALTITSYAVAEGTAPLRIPLTVHASTIKRGEVNSTGDTFGMGVCQVSELRISAGATGSRNATTAGGLTRNSALVISLAQGVALNGAVRTSEVLSGVATTELALVGRLGVGGIIAGDTASTLSLQGTLVGTPRATGDVGTRLGLVSAVRTAAVLRASSDVRVVLQGSIFGAPRLSGALETTTALSGTLRTSGVASGSAVTDLALAGQLSAVGRVHGNIVPGQVALFGTVGTGAILPGATLQQTLALAGRVAATAIADGQLQSDLPLQGQVSATVVARGSAGLQLPLTGTVGSQSQVYGSAISSLALVGTLRSGSVVSGSVDTITALQGSVAETPCLYGQAGTRQAVTGVTANTVVVTGTATAETPFTGYLSIVPVVTGALHSTVAFSGTVLGNSRVTPALFPTDGPTLALTGTLFGGARLTAPYIINTWVGGALPTGVVRGMLVEAGMTHRIRTSGVYLMVHFQPERPVMSGSAPIVRPLNPLSGPVNMPEFLNETFTPVRTPVSMPCLVYDARTMGSDEDFRRYGIGSYQAGADIIVRVLVSDAVEGNIAQGTGTLFDACDFVECRGRRYKVLKVEPIAAGFRIPVTIHVWLAGGQGQPVE